MVSPFPPPSFEALATTSCTVRGVLAAGSSNDAYIHPVTGALFTSAAQTVVVRYDLDNRTGAFIEPPVVIAGSTTAGYANATGALAFFSDVSNFAGDGDHIVYVAETNVNFCVRSINITSLEVGAVAGNFVNAIVDGVGTNASLQYPLALAYHPLKNILYVGGMTTAIRKIDLSTRNVTTICLNVNWPHDLRLTPSCDTLFVSVYQTHT